MGVYAVTVRIVRASNGGQFISFIQHVYGVLELTVDLVTVTSRKVHSANFKRDLKVEAVIRVNQP
jgi:hypothetical protein